ncbi:acetylserotonin O-methyltransferase [Pararhizobium mangrovi]|uniref:acetylserotonin O-methyltransferase n=1 Tax=Pararhizobium mangrovi TaxID=2590452 RepID=UPI001F1ABA98|nr:acetylserotonin O-methyltransferase [Pararhizobium mangrovi]
MADPRFSAFAARSPFLRPIVRRRVLSLFDLAAGFVYAQVLAAVVELDLPERLRDGPLALTDLARRVDLPPERMAVLVEAASALGILERGESESVRLGPHGAAMLADPGIAAMVRHHVHLYRDLADPVALLREPEPPGALSSYWAYAGRPAGEGPDVTADTRSYTTLMARSQAMIAREVVAAYPFARHRHMLDIGGGDGTFIARVGEAAPRLAFTLFDLPNVAEPSKTVLPDDIAGRTHVVGGNFTTDPLPKGADLVTLVRILHDHDDAIVRTLLASVHAALDAGGRILVAEPMAGTRGAERVASAYFGFYLLAMGQGRPRRKEELADMLKAAGFRHVREHRTNLPALVRVISAQR